VARARLVDHRRREVEALDVRAARREVRGDLARAAADLDDAAAADALGERVEERTVERLAASSSPSCARYAAATVA